MATVETLPPRVTNIIGEAFDPIPQRSSVFAPSVPAVNLHDIYALTGAPYSPFCQLLTSSIAEAWDRVPEELYAKISGACAKNELGGNKDTVVASWGNDKVTEWVSMFC